MVGNAAVGKRIVSARRTARHDIPKRKEIHMTDAERDIVRELKSIEKQLKRIADALGLIVETNSEYQDFEEYNAEEILK
jgi:hypothetical protein